MKRFRVDIARSALADVEEAFWHIHSDSPQNAAGWLRELYDRIETLETLPQRCGLIRENDAFEQEVRCLLHYSHRVIFTVDEEAAIVRVHRVRHAARDDLAGGEL